MVVAVTLALALAFEPAEPGFMSRPPRDANAALLDRAFLWRITFVSLLIGGATLAMFEMGLALDMPLDVARTMAVNTQVFGHAFYLFNCRFLNASSLRLGLLFSNRVAWITVGVLICLQMLFVYAPFMHRWFGTAPQEARHWLVPLAIGLAVLLLVESEKALLRLCGRTPPQMRRDRT